MAAVWCEVAGVKPVLTTPGLARVVGVDRYHAHEWVRGERFPSARSVLRLSRALGVSADAVLLTCERAHERLAARRAAERARVEAENE